MKKIKILLVSILTLMLSLFCFTGCGEKGKYEIKEYVTGSITKTADDDNDSFIELKKDDVAVVSIDLVVFELEGEGTWKKGDEKNEIVLSVSGIDYTVVKDGKTLTMDVGVAKIVFEK